MFTGLVEAISRIASIEGPRLSLEMPTEWDEDDLDLGESIAVNGCCLTLIGKAPLAFETSEETRQRTAMDAWAPGRLVNLERAMRLGDRLGGHIVQGHVDCTGEITQIAERDGWWEFGFSVPADEDRYLIDKGSVCLDGISLTVIEPRGGKFSAAIIPHTFASTSLKENKAGDRMNVEFDVLAKHVEKLLARS